MKNNSALVVLIIIVVFFLYQTLNTGTELFSVELYDKENNQIEKQSIQKIVGVELVQTLFNQKTNENLVFMQSTFNAEEDESISIFKMKIDNPFDSTATIKKIEVYKNNQLLYVHESNKILQIGKSFVYKSNEIDLTAEFNKKNTISFKVFFESINGEEEVQEFRYEYLYLLQCYGNIGCAPPIDVCDLNNVARLSTDPQETFCTRLCDDHKDCFDGQICIQGYCGY